VEQEFFSASISETLNSQQVSAEKIFSLARIFSFEGGKHVNVDLRKPFCRTMDRRMNSTGLRFAPGPCLPDANQ